jgi:hypothetical protein
MEISIAANVVDRKNPDGTANGANEPPGGSDPLIAGNHISPLRAVM